MENVQLRAEIREKAGKSATRQVRRNGRIPAVLYGERVGNVLLQVDPKELRQSLMTPAGMNTVLRLTVPGQGQVLAMFKEVQRNHQSGEIVHVDFHQISLRDKVTVEIPIILQGEAPGAKEGGVIQHQLRTVEVECLPTEIPENIIADISNLNIGDSLYVRDLAANGVEIKEEADTVVVTIVQPTKAETEPAADEAAEEPAAEPAPAETE